VTSFKDATTADLVVAERIEWLWPLESDSEDGRIGRGMIHVIAGKPDVGKGMVSVRIGADLAKAGFNVLHSAIEDSPGLITKPRYQAAGCTGDALKRIHLNRFRLPVNQAEFEAYCIQHKIDLVVIDPLASHLSDGVSRHSDNIRRVTDPLTAFIEKQRIAVIVVEHALKHVSKNADPLSAIGGSSSGLPAVTRMGFIFGADPDSDDRILCHVKGNVVERRAAMRFEVDITDVPVNVIDTETGEVSQEDHQFPALLYQDDVIFDPIRLLVKQNEDSKIGRPNDKRAAAAEYLTSYLYTAHQTGLPKAGRWPATNPGDGVPAGRAMEDAKQYGMTEKTLRRAKSEMNVVVDPPGGGRNCVWSLPDDVISLLTGGDDTPDEDRKVEPDKENTVGDFDAELAKFLDTGADADDDTQGEL
jgi:hypothetical protein